MPDIETKRNQAYPTQQGMIEECFQSAASIEDSSYTRPEANGDHHLIQPIIILHHTWCDERPARCHIVILKVPHGIKNHNQNSSGPQQRTEALPSSRNLITGRRVLRIDVAESY